MSWSDRFRMKRTSAMRKTKVRERGFYVCCNLISEKVGAMEDPNQRHQKGNYNKKVGKDAKNNVRLNSKANSAESRR